MIANVANLDKMAIVVAHPGHELRVFSWLEQNRPTVHVLTDGSGRDRHGRLHFTSKLLQRSGAQPGTIYGRYTDLELYETVLRGDVTLLRHVVDELTDALVRQDIEFVLGDAAEGEFMAHDLWRQLRILAVERAESILERPIAEFEFAVDSHPHKCPDSLKEHSIRLALDDEAFYRKLAAAYENHRVRPFVDKMLASFGADAFRTECLFPMSQDSLLTPELKRVPNYEQHGEAMVAEGVYPEVIRYHQHLVPLFVALRQSELVTA